MSKKMQWTKPQLIILARGTPEEAVLTHCKQIGMSSSPYTGGPESTEQDACSRGAVGNCGACQARSGS